MTEMYMVMINKIAETGDLWYWVRHYGEYLKLMFSYPSVVAINVISIAFVVIAIVAVVLLIKRAIKIIDENFEYVGNK